MEKLMIKGGRPLYGEVQVSGAKNSAVALIPATLLAESTTILENLPHIRDVLIYVEILKDLGAEISQENGELHIDAGQLTNLPMSDGKVKELRASYYLMGALLGRFGEATVGLPGGCNLGPRPIDQHIKGFEALGAKVVHRDGALHLFASKLKGARVYLDVVSVGATINIMLAAARAEGQTVIENAAKEPEIIDVATLLTAMGAKVKGAGTDVIRIQGCAKLTGCRHSVIPDRIEAGTFMVAAAATQGEVTVNNLIPKHMEPVTAKLREMGAEVEEWDEALQIRGGKAYQSIHIRTLPYPGFPTDLQQPFTSLLTMACGTSFVVDNIYSSRFRHIDELSRMGADVRVEGSSAVIRGQASLYGAQVRASDLRAGAALVIAGLMASDITEIIGVEHINRGYQDLVGKLKSLGSEIWRESQ
ncbi:UDP-N-acetylglucosamine 1-carboxyvinyltransferase [Kroppenstedtia pulmonis]|uniref:UDP-N-acetylglucosamine 1-carboxyvinyltransferase n=1 Tax=Kroppenstedtia pulmonis TaxID=1380685 RepID=A0A7D3Y6Q6_9BACL|nr:UDP-N-acetylglucosamine 1-carboxyvinyltransferase [Kroppenstedtia pulmonis]QKG85745.1 UDP-N-acetylglucosamine 1-carboxyvinyltransferase [Kroppenstedtia pulmonis]